MTRSQFGESRIILGKQIKAAREHRQITQKELSKVTGLDQSNLSKIESGESNFVIDTLFKIAEALSCDIKFSLK